MRGWFQRKPDEPDWTLLSGIDIRKAGVAVALLAVLGLAGWQGYQHYLVWHEQRLVSQARKFSRQADIRSSLLNLRQALALNPTNLAATRLMAELSDQARAPEAVAWRVRLDQLQPHRLENQLALASVALRMGELGAAQQALEQVDSAGRQTLAYNQTMATWAFQAKHFDLAEQYFEKVLRRQRTNEFSQLNLALARLQSARPEAHSEAVAVLEQLRRNPQFQTVALRALLVAAKRNKQPAQVLLLARELKDRPQAGYQDQLPYLDALQQSHHPEFAAQLSQYQARAEAEPQDIFLLVEWMNTSGLAAPALEWVARLAPEMRQRIPGGGFAGARPDTAIDPGNPPAADP